MHWSFMASLVIFSLFVNTGCQGPDKSEFVQVKGRQFEVNGKPYYFSGTNLWYGCNLASSGIAGDRERLERELDRLKSLGITNLRIMGASEGSDEDCFAKPTIQPTQGVFNEDLLDGLDYLLYAMKERGMYAVIYLNNYWIWSGGMARYVSWNGGGKIPNPHRESVTWTDFMTFSAKFYSNKQANKAFRDYIQRIINRKNKYTALQYKEDPVIMAWQLANEPRPGRRGIGENNISDFIKWIGETAAYIHSLDENHLVSIGSEGTIGCLDSEKLYTKIHSFKDVDYLTMHLWVSIWGWFDANKSNATLPEAEKKAEEYIQKQIELAEEIGKPLVLEEFGIPRDNQSFSPAESTTARDHFYKTIFNLIFGRAVSGSLLAGSNFWAWGGEGRPAKHGESIWKLGDDLVGDPPQEPPGLFSVFDTDLRTLEIITEHGKQMKQLCKDGARKY